MENRLLNRLQGSDKKGLFARTQTAISYPTGFPSFDYRNGYMVQVRELDESIVAEYPSTGVVGGSFMTIVGKSGTAKTTWASQLAANIVRKFPSGFVQHFDLEQALNYTRIKNITGYSQNELASKYVLKQEKTYIEDIFDSIMDIQIEKEKHRGDYEYDTRLRDEFNHPIISLEPTVVLVDSIPTLASRDTDNGDMEGSTYANRVAKALSQFYKRLTPVIKSANIIVISINHINQKIEINPRAKSQPQLIYLKMDETLPGGNAPIYYAHCLVKFSTMVGQKYDVEENGFDGFRVKAELMKSRTNRAGQFCYLAYDQETGFDVPYSQYEFADQYELITGRNPYSRIIGHDEVKFDTRKFRKEFLENEALRYALFDKTIPILNSQLSKVRSADEAQMALTQLDVLERLAASSENENFDDVANIEYIPIDERKTGEGAVRIKKSA